MKMSAPPILVWALMACALASPAATGQPATDERPLRNGEQRAVAPDPTLKVLTADDAPAELLDVQMSLNFNRTPAVVYVTLHNRSTAVLNRANVACYVFDGKLRLHLASFGVVSRPVAPSGLLSLPKTRSAPLRSRQRPPKRLDRVRVGFVAMA